MSQWSQYRDAVASGRLAKTQVEFGRRARRYRVTVLTPLIRRRRIDYRTGSGSDRVLRPKVVQFNEHTVATAPGSVIVLPPPGVNHCPLALPIKHAAPPAQRQVSQVCHYYFLCKATSKCILHSGHGKTRMEDLADEYATSQRTA